MKLSSNTLCNYRRSLHREDDGLQREELCLSSLNGSFVLAAAEKELQTYFVWIFFVASREPSLPQLRRKSNFKRLNQKLHL